MSEELTPMQRQYRAIKRELPPGSILMFRLGDFYEMFGEDAVIVDSGREGDGTPLQYSCLENPMGGGAW